MFDHVKSEIVKAAEAPNGDREHGRDTPTLRIDDQQRRGKNSDDQEKNALELNPKRIR
jgi:hypothetical protein